MEENRRHIEEKFFSKIYFYIKNSNGSIPDKEEADNHWVRSFIPGLGIRSFDFRANRLFFVKNERMSDSLKKMRDSLIRSFLVSEMSDSLT